MPWEGVNKLMPKCVLIQKTRSSAFYLMLDTAGLNLCAMPAPALLPPQEVELQGDKDTREKGQSGFALKV